MKLICKNLIFQLKNIKLVKLVIFKNNTIFNNKSKRFKDINIYGASKVFFDNFKGENYLVVALYGNNISKYLNNSNYLSRLQKVADDKKRMSMQI